MVVKESDAYVGLKNIALAAAHLENDQDGAAHLLRSLSTVTPSSLSPLSRSPYGLTSFNRENGIESVSKPALIPPDLKFNAIDAPSPSTIISSIKENDVLCGRGGETNHHKGNIRYRHLVKSWQPAYIAAKRRDKPCIARLIVNKVRSVEGRFLKKGADGQWRDVGNGKAREKTSQALREGAPEMRALVSPIMLDHDRENGRNPIHPLKSDDVRREVSLSSYFTDDSLSSPATSDWENDSDKNTAYRKRKDIGRNDSYRLNAKTLVNSIKTSNGIEFQDTSRGPRIKMFKARMLSGK